MAAALTLGGILVALALGADNIDHKVLYTAPVVDDVAEVRSGPSTNFYPTEKLPRGTVVEVVNERNDGWLEIRPPGGSFSWINSRFLEKLNNRTWVVTTHDDAPVEVRYGSKLNNAEPSVVGVRVRRGTQVTALGPEIAGKEASWMPIEPPPGELRYLPAKSVTRPAPQANAAPVPAPLPMPGGSPPPPTAPSGFTLTAANTASASPLPGTGGAALSPQAQQLEQEAQQLERYNRLAEASQKYMELGRLVYNDNHDLAMQYFNRSYYLRDANRGTPAPQNSQAAYGAPAAQNRLYPVSGGSSVPSYNPCPPANCPPAACAPTPQYQQANYVPPPAPGPTTTYQGRLQRAGRGIDGKPTYTLARYVPETKSWTPLTYVTATSGVNLDAYLDRDVTISGPLVYRMEERNYHMEARQVTPTP